MDVQQIDTKELADVIAKTYGKEVFTMAELMGILRNCDFSDVEARKIVRKAFKAKTIGRVSFRQIRRNFLSGATLVVLSVNIRQ